MSLKTHSTLSSLIREKLTNATFLIRIHNLIGATPVEMVHNKVHTSVIMIELKSRTYNAYTANISRPQD